MSGQDLDEALLWVEHPGTRADYLELSDAVGLGAGERVLLLQPGVIAEGVIEDSAGRPLEGVEVRSYQCHRGPVGLTDRRGRFRLVGVEEVAETVAGPNEVDLEIRHRSTSRIRTPSTGGRSSRATAGCRGRRCDCGSPRGASPRRRRRG